MLRIFLVLSLAVALAGVAFSFVLKDKVTSLSEERTRFGTERDQAITEATQAKAAEKKARDAEKQAKSDLEIMTQEFTSAKTSLNETEGQLTRTARELEDTKVARDLAQRSLAQWLATGVKVDQIMALKAEGQRLVAERDAFAEEKKVMSREIARLNDDLNVYRGKGSEVMMPDVRGKITAVNASFDFVELNIGSDDGLKQNGKLIVSRGETLLGKVQLVRVNERSAVANVLPDWKKGELKAGDSVMTSYEALTR